MMTLNIEGDTIHPMELYDLAKVTD